MTTITVTAAQGGSTANGILLRVLVLTQAAAVQNGATLAASVGNTNIDAAITPGQTGSRVYLAGTGSQGSYTVTAATAGIDSFSDSTNGGQYLSGKASATSTAGTPKTLGWTDNSVGLGYAMMEVLQAGTLTEDSSAPAAATSVTATSVTTASFTPPDGALLVALVATNGGASTVTVTVSDSSSLTWTQVVKANTAGSDYAGIFTARLPGGGTPAAPPSPLMALPPSFRAAFAHTSRPVLPLPQQCGAADQDSGSGGDASAPLSIVPAAGDAAAAADGGEQAAAAAGDSDNAEAGADNGELVTPGGTGTRERGTADDAGEQVVLPVTDAIAGADGTEAIAFSAAADVTGAGSDQETGPGVVPVPDTGHGADGAVLTAAAADSDSSDAAADGGEAVAAAPAGSDAGAGQDGGEAVYIVPVFVSRLRLSPSWQAAFRHGSRPVLPQPYPQGTGHGDGDGAAAADGAETVLLADGDGSAAADAGAPVVESMQAAVVTAQVPPSWQNRFTYLSKHIIPGFAAGGIHVITDAEAAAGTDAGALQGALGAEQCTGTDSGFTAIADAEGGTAAEAELPFPFAGSDFSGTAADLELTAWPGSADAASCASTEYWSGPLADGDSAHPGTDGAETFSFTDGDSGAAGETHIIDVYTFQPPFRWTGGGFELRWHGRAVWAGPRPSRAALELAARLSGAELAQDADQARGEDEEQPALDVRLAARAALAVTVEVTS